MIAIRTYFPQVSTSFCRQLALHLPSTYPDSHDSLLVPLLGVTYVELRVTASALVEGTLGLGGRLDGVDARAGSGWCGHFEYVVGGEVMRLGIIDGVDGGGMMLAWRCAMLRFWRLGKSRVICWSRAKAIGSWMIGWLGLG